jgi:hypothetical protein
VKSRPVAPWQTIRLRYAGADVRADPEMQGHHVGNMTFAVVVVDGMRYRTDHTGVSELSDLARLSN